MTHFSLEQAIGQLEKRKGGYFYLKIPADLVAQFPKKRATRLICKIDETLSFSCGLNHLGDGNFYLIVGKKRLEKLGKVVGDQVSFEIFEDPNPLGVEEPEVLLVLLSQDPQLKDIYDSLTDGKKRSLIFSINKVKNMDLQVEKILKFLEGI
ncbi:MAG: DUF1905 domain-containing protein [Bacteroidota bacterium]